MSEKIGAINNTLKPCVLCKWNRSAPAGRYCVNPEIPANKIAMAVDGWINGMTPWGKHRNDCKGLRAEFIGGCGLLGKYFEMRTEPDCIVDGTIRPEGGNYVEWSKKCIANDSYKASPGTREILERYVQENTI